MNAKERKLNERAAFDAATTLCFHIEHHWRGASERILGVIAIAMGLACRRF
jgi:hypothetical protein